MWCTNCGAKIEDGMKFCTACGNKVDVADGTPATDNNNTFVLKATNDTVSNVPPRVNVAPQVPVYAPTDYEENKTVKAEKAKAGYIIILVICILVIVVSMGLVVWTVLGESIGSRKDDTDIEEEIDDDDDDGDETEEEVDGTTDSSEPSQSQTTIIGTGTAIQDTEAPAAEEPIEEEPEEVEEESQYLLEDSDCRYISKEELYDFDEWECRLARNELYARHGRIFDTPEVQEYFESKDWYHGSIYSDEWNSGKGDNKYFNDYEIANRDLIVKYEKEMGWR